MISKYTIGVDQASGESEDCLILGERDKDGTITIMFEHRGPFDAFWIAALVERANLQLEQEEAGKCPHCGSGRIVVTSKGDCRMTHCGACGEELPD